MKRVLMVSEKFPPFNLSGSARPFYFAKYLPEHGYAPTVISASAPNGEARDESLLLELPQEVRVYRSPYVFSPMLARLPSRRSRPPARRGLRPPAPPPRPSAWARLHASTQYLRWWLHWEVDWGVTGTLAGAIGAARERPQLVWVTGPHFRNYEIGRRLAQWLHLPLVIDMRDPWTYGSLWRPKNDAIARAERARAVRTLSAASRVVFTSPLTQQVMSERFPELESDRWLTITNGYDDVRVEPLRDCPEDRCLFRYVGTLNERRTPDVLIEAFRSAAASAEFRASAAIEFIGGAGGHESKAQLAPGCEVRFRPHVSRSDSLRYMFGSDVNILLQTIAEGQDVVSGKAFEYLHAGKPILAVVDPAGGDAWLMRETGAGEIATWTDAGAISAAMLRAWRAWLAGRSGAGGPSPPPPKSLPYSRRLLTAKLAAVFDQVLDERR